jgi:hypothetical protein
VSLETLAIVASPYVCPAPICITSPSLTPAVEKLVPEPVITRVQG